jgi:hypothetical protein
MKHERPKEYRCVETANMDGDSSYMIQLEHRRWATGRVFWVDVFATPLDLEEALYRMKKLQFRERITVLDVADLSQRVFHKNKAEEARRIEAERLKHCPDYVPEEDQADF